MEHRREFKSIDDLHQERLELFRRMFSSGHPIAVAAALHYCRERKVRPPYWVVEAGDDLLCGLLKRGRPNRRGRSCGYVDRHRQDRIDFSRWDQVRVVRDKQKELKEEVEYLRSRANIPHPKLQDREKLLEWVGSTLNRAFECAAILLEGTDAYASPDAIKRSYFQVERNNKDPNQRLRYHIFDCDFLAKIGIKHEIALRPGRKIVPLYELTL